MILNRNYVHFIMNKRRVPKRFKVILYADNIKEKYRVVINLFALLSE